MRRSVPLLRWLTVPYRPSAADQAFLQRARQQTRDGLAVTVAVLSDQESRQHFGVSMAGRGLQPVWIRAVNESPFAVRLDFFSVDPTYYTPLEAAHVCHFSTGRRLVGFGLLAWLYLPFLPVLLCKLVSARAANRRMDAHFKRQGFRGGPILPGQERTGVVFTSVDEGAKNLDIRFLAQERALEFDFSLPVPGLAVSTVTPLSELAPQQPLSDDQMQAWARSFARCTTNKTGDVEGDPLNLVVVGDGPTIRQCFGGRWDLAETITLATCLKTAKAFLLDAEYRYSPVSSLYVGGRVQDLALQRARASINERVHLRLWRSPFSFDGMPIWIGQVSRDIGVRFTPKTWNLTTHRIDPDVDEARDYDIDYLLSGRRVARFGYVAGAGRASAESPRRNLTGDPYFTDGQRALLVLSANRTTPTFVDWT
jgi:hypothetical protein